MMHCQEIDYSIQGHDFQYVEIELDAGETVIAEAGSMMYMEDGVSYEAKLGDGSNPKSGILDNLWGAGKRWLAGDTLFLTHFTNQAQTKKKVVFAAPYPGAIIPLNLKEHNENIICQKSAFLCAARGTQITVTLTKKFGAGLFGGEGFILQKIMGDGLAFIAAGGAIVKKQLNNETLKVDAGCIVGFESQIDYDIARAGNLKSMIFGGEGLFLATLSGTGTAWLQSMPFSRLCDRIIASAPAEGGKSVGEGSILGNLFKN
ncbi:MAG: TIGR00266 family protein [Legionellales bacterium]|nr:TIGR00266 family protein [Legionellales bacterium]